MAGAPLVKMGNKLATRNSVNSIQARAVVEETFPQQFAVYDLGQFLMLLSMSQTPDIEFHEKHLEIKHGGGVNHRDFYICHFLLHLPVDAGAPRLSLIDLHRAQVREKTPRRWRDKDLAALYFSALDIGLTKRDGLRFLKTYFARPLRGILQDERALLGHLESESVRLMARYQRKYAPGADA